MLEAPTKRGYSMGAHMLLPPIELWSALAFAAALGLAAWLGKRGMAWACLIGFLYPGLGGVFYFLKGWTVAGHIVGLSEAERSLHDLGTGTEEWTWVWLLSSTVVALAGLVCAFGGSLIGLSIRAIVKRRISNDHQDSPLSPQ